MDSEIRVRWSPAGVLSLVSMPLLLAGVTAACSGLHNRGEELKACRAAGAPCSVDAECCSGRCRTVEGTHQVRACTFTFESRRLQGEIRFAGARGDGSTSPIVSGGLASMREDRRGPADDGFRFCSLPPVSENLSSLPGFHPSRQGEDAGHL